MDALKVIIADDGKSCSNYAGIFLDKKEIEVVMFTLTALAF